MCCIPFHCRMCVAVLLLAPRLLLIVCRHRSCRPMFHLEEPRSGSLWWSFNNRDRHTCVCVCVCFLSGMSTLK